MWRVTSVNIEDNTVNQITTYSKYYAKKMYDAQKIDEEDGYVRDVKMFEVSYEEAMQARQGIKEG